MSLKRVEKKKLLGRSNKDISLKICWGLHLWLFICCKTKLKKIILKYIKAFFATYTLFAKKNFYIEKKFLNEIFFYWKKLFFTEKNLNENIKNIYLISEIYYYTENKMFQIKYKSFLHIFSFCKNFFLIIRNIFVKTSLWTQ